jgi:hypothetical protein
MVGGKSVVMMKRKVTVSEGEYKGKLLTRIWEVGFDRVRVAGNLRVRGIVFQTTKFPTGKEERRIIDDDIYGDSKAEVLKTAKKLYG